MRSGEMRHRLSIQEYRYVSRDPNTGDVIYEWVEIGHMWAKVEGIQGREFLAAAAEQAETTWRIITRYRTDIEISQTKRLVLDGMTFDIKASLPDNRRRQLVLMAETGVTVS